MGRHWEDVCVWRWRFRGWDGSEGADLEWRGAPPTPWIPPTTWSCSCFLSSIVFSSCVTHANSASLSWISRSSASVSSRAALISRSRPTCFDTKASSVWKHTLASSNDSASSSWCVVHSLQSLHLLWRTVQSSKSHVHLELSNRVLPEPIWSPSPLIDPSGIMAGVIGVCQWTTVSRETEDGGSEVRDDYLAWALDPLVPQSSGEFGMLASGHRLCALKCHRNCGQVPCACAVDF